MSSTNKSLFVKGLNEETTQQDLRDLFTRYGKVNDIYIPISYHTRRPRGFAYVAFEDLEEAKRAVRKLDGTLFHGREIRVEHAQGDRKTPYEMRQKDGPRNGNSSSSSRRRSFDRNGSDYSRSRYPHRSRSRSPALHRPARRRSSSPVRSSHRASDSDRHRSANHSRSDRSPGRDRFKRASGRDNSDDRSHRRSDREERHHHKSHGDSNNGSHRQDV